MLHFLVWRDGRVVRHGSAKPATPVQFRFAPPGFVRNIVENEACPGIAGEAATPGRSPMPRTTPGQATPVSIERLIERTYSMNSGMTEMKNSCYVYILESIENPSRHYTGLTDDVAERLKKHNQGGCPHTSKFKPWRIRTAISFDDRERAAAFEKYLKSHSGRAFASKHF